MTTTLVSVGLVIFGILLMIALVRSSRSAKTRPAPRSRVAAPSPDDVTARIAATPVDRAVPDLPETREFAAPGGRGRLLEYGGDGPGYLLDAPFAIVAVETTGFSPRNGDRIVEIAIARVDRHGRIEDEYATLLSPGRDVGPVFVHGISNIDVRDAPTFEDVAGDVLARLDGAIVVAHNAVIEDRFLAAEFARIGVRMPVMPALCTLWLAQRTVRVPNHRLGTLARYAGLPTVEAHSALGAVRTLVELLPELLEMFGRPLQYPSRPTPLPLLDRGARLLPRELEPRKGADPWMAALMARLPISAAEAGDADVQRYLDALGVAFEDGWIAGHEAKELARLAGSAGLGVAQVHGLHRRYLEWLRSAALRDTILTTAEIRQLKRAAEALGLPGYFDELRPTSPQDLIAAGHVPLPGPARCRNCRQPGHYEIMCPERVAAAG